MKKSDFGDIYKKGFDKKWWKKKAAMNCRGVGVEKALDQCNKASMGINGVIEYTDVNEAVFWYDANTALKFLESNLKKARSKCGKSQAETKQAIDEYYLPRIQKNKIVLKKAEKEVSQPERKFD